jgi:hypothetical protein
LYSGSTSQYGGEGGGGEGGGLGGGGEGGGDGDVLAAANGERKKHERRSSARRIYTYIIASRFFGRALPIPTTASSIIIFASDGRSW